METNKIIVISAQQTTDDSAHEPICELNDFELAVVGGGGGDVVFA